MNKKIMVLLGLAFITNSSLSNEFKEGLKSGKEALQQGPLSHTIQETVQTAEIQAILNQSMPKDVTLDSSALPHHTANEAIESSKNSTGKALNQQLLKQAQQLKEKEVVIQENGIHAVTLTPEQTQEKPLTPNQIINQNLLQMETFPNVRNPATEPAFSAIESQDIHEKEFKNPKDFTVSLQYKYVMEEKEVARTESYEMGCSTTLLGTVFQCTQKLQIKVNPQPLIDLDKTITATFRGRAYNLLTFHINFNTGKITGGGNSDNYFHLSDSLNQAFGPNTQVTLQQHSSYHEDPEAVRHTIDASPTSANGFTASYTAFQPKTGNRHKGNRNTLRGGVLKYRFTEQKRNPPTLVSETWQGDCQDLEDLTALGECQIVQEHCLEGPQTRQFGEVPFLSLNRKCWKKRLTYHCNVPQGANDCSSIPKECQKTSSEFIKFLNQHAVEIHHFKCQRAVTETKQLSKNKGSRWVPAGDYQKNNDIGEAIASLNIAKEIATGFRGEAQGLGGCFFGGKAMECTTRPKDCCSNKKGFWRKMTGCRETEQQLALNITAGNCHEIGEYQVKKSVLQKIGHVDKKGYCCFNSKLARIIQEGARQQLSLDWGLPESPNCRALTLTEIQRIDWSLIDFSEIAKDFIEKAKQQTLSPHTLTVIQNQLRTTLQKSVTELKIQYPHTPQGEKQQQETLQLQETIQKEDNKRRLRGTTQ